jgi:hypothetical protein
MFTLARIYLYSLWKREDLIRVSLDSLAYQRSIPMKCRVVFAVITMLPLFTTAIFAQQSSSDSSPDVAFWVAYWAQPRIALFGPEQDAFNKNVQEILFPWNDHEEPSNPSALDDNVRWLNDHSNDRFYINGYASSRGDVVYNLALSQAASGLGQTGVATL